MWRSVGLNERSGEESGRLWEAAGGPIGCEGDVNSEKKKTCFEPTLASNRWEGQVSKYRRNLDYCLEGLQTRKRSSGLLDPPQAVGRVGRRTCQ